LSGTTRSPSSRGSGTSDLVLYMSTYLYYVYLEGGGEAMASTPARPVWLLTINRAKTKLITIDKKME